MTHLPPESFEAVCSRWEQLIKGFIGQLSDENIPALANAQWTYEKKHINVYPADSDGKKKRGARGPYFHSSISLNRNEANAVWGKFKQFSKEYGLNKIERLYNNEELGWYDFEASNTNTGDQFSCGVRVPGEWSKAGIHLSMFIGPRYRSEDLHA